MKTKVLVDIEMTCEPDSDIYSYLANTLEKQAKEAEKWAKDFMEFVKDHRSQDSVIISVQKVYEDQCSLCGNRWEEEEDGTGTPVCCEKAIAKFLEERGKE